MMASSIKEFVNGDIHPNDLAIITVDCPQSPQHHELREDKELETGDSAIKVPIRKRKLSGAAYDDPMAERAKLVKKIILSLMRPSYVLGLGPDKLRLQHRGILRYMLRRLVNEQNWVEASGVLSVYLQAMVKDKFPFENQFKYSVLLKVLKRVENSLINPTRIKNLYDVWMRKNGSMKDNPVENRYIVHLEFILFFIMQGDIGEAYEAVQCLKQENGSDHDPISNMVMGFVFYKLWYSCIPKEFQWKDSDQFDSPVTSFIEGDKFSDQHGQSERHKTFETHIGETFYKCDSNTSVSKDKKISMDSGINQGIGVPMEIDVIHQREKPLPNFQPQRFYLDSEEHSRNSNSGLNHRFQTQDASSLYALEGLDSWLLPLHVPDHNSFDNFISLHNKLLNDYYREAVKHLQAVVDSTSTASAALLPLVQLLLIGGQVDEALNMLEKQCSNFASALPFRLKTTLLERFDSNNFLLLASSFEDRLKKDPTCRESLAKLIRMHQNGNYSVESLVEMIAFHLDARDAEHSTWKVFALCFFVLSSEEEDRRSTCINNNKDECRQQSSLLSDIPEVFTKKSWRVRCRWWLTRHFSHNKLESEIEIGDLQLLAYKAVCASYMYGREFHYVVKAYSHLEKENDRDLLSFLDNHKHNSHGFL